MNMLINQEDRPRHQAAARHVTKVLCILAALMMSMPSMSRAQSGSVPPLRHEINKGVVGVMGASLTGTNLRMASDMALALNDGNELRVVPSVGLGSFQAIQDLLYLRGIDVAIVNADVLDFFREKDIIPGVNLDNHVRYVARLYENEFHLLARDNIRSIEDLHGAKVNYGSNGSGTFMAASVIFESLGITPDVQGDSHQKALVKLRNGEIDAMCFTVGKPWKSIEGISRQDGMHFVEVPIERVRGSYNSAELNSTDYPLLINPGEVVRTPSVDVIMAVYNWPADHPRRENLERFVNAFQANAGKLQEESYHPKWKELNLSRDVVGWQRFRVEAGS